MYSVTVTVDWYQCSETYILSVCCQCLILLNTLQILSVSILAVSDSVEKNVALSFTFYKLIWSVL